MAKKARVVIKEEFRPFMDALGLSDFDSFMNFSGGRMVKEITARTITRVEARAMGVAKSFYLKRHRGVKTGRGRRFLNALSGKSITDAGREWEAIEALHKAGISAVRGVAMGERSLACGVDESFVMTEELSGYVQLEAMARDAKLPLTREEIFLKRSLIRETARVVRAFHAAGFNHRDLYLTHVLAKRHGGGWSVKLIDLQRVEHRTRLRARWLVKDVSALDYSSPRGVVTRADRMRFYKIYSGRDRLLAEDRAFIKSVARKTKRVAGHTVKMYAMRAERKKRGLLER
jgi:hypothetical protein